MKKFYFLMAYLCLHITSQAQTDSTVKEDEADTIRIGRMIIIKKGGSRDNDSSRPDSPRPERHRSDRNPSNVSTHWGIVDIGFSNFRDNTIYSSPQTQQFAAGSNEDWFQLRNGKSINVNVWFFMQRVNLVKHVINLKYGLGLELNNYMYEGNIRYNENPTQIYMDVIDYSKNKLATDYLTVPMMLNFNFTPHAEKGYKNFGFSVGASAGYLYSSRQKYISTETGKQKTKDDFDLHTVKISYVAELQLGPVKFYGSLADRSMFKKGLDQTPYNIGIRLSTW
jgi:hypothetical protein